MSVLKLITEWMIQHHPRNKLRIVIQILVLTLSNILVFPVSTCPKTQMTGALSTSVDLFFSASSFLF